MKKVIFACVAALVPHGNHFHAVPHTETHHDVVPHRGGHQFGHWNALIQN